MHMDLELVPPYVINSTSGNPVFSSEGSYTTSFEDTGCDVIAEIPRHNRL